MWAPCRASATRSMRHRRQTIDVVESSSRSHPPKIPIVIFSKTSSKARSKGPKSGLDSCRCRNEAAQSAMGMSSHCRTVALVFGISINKDVVRRILAACGTRLHISDVSNRSRLRRFVHAVTDRAPKTTTTSVERCPAPKTCYTRTRSLL
jgi:hypothetical protein